MAPLVAAVAGGIASSFAGSVLQGVLSGLALKIVSGVIGAVVSYGVNAVTAKKPKRAEPFTRQAVDRLQNLRSPVAPHVVIYGTTKVGGPQTYATSSGAGNQYIHVIIPVAGHEVAGIDSVFFNEDEITAGQLDASGNVTSGKYAGNARIKKYLGTASQTADADLMAEAPSSEWTSDHRGRGIAYLYVRLNYSQDLFPGGVPNITAIVRGRLVYDPRDAQTKHSDNAALVTLDYLRASFGLGISASEWDATWWQAQANLCDELVTINAASATQKRYTANGSFTLDEAPLDIIDKLLSASVGTVTYVQGQYFLHAAAYVAPTVTLTTKDLRGPIEIIARKPRAELFNAVRGTFVDPAQFWQPTDYPPVINATYETQDAGERIYRDVSMPMVTDAIRAQRMAKILLERARQPITITFPAKLSAARLRVWDVVAVTINGPSPGLDLGWTAKPFRVVRWAIAEDGGVDLTLQEEASAIYDWAYGEATTVDPAPDTSLTTPFEAPPAITGLAAFSGDNELDVRADGTVVSRVRLTWTQVPNIYVTSGGRIEVQYRQTGETDWSAGPAALGLDTEVTIPDVADGTAYDFRVRPVNSLAVFGSWSSLNSYSVQGKLAPPSAVSTFTVAVKADGTRSFAWTHIPQPADVRAGGGYRIRYFLGSTSDWGAMTALHTGLLTSSPYETSDLNAGTYTLAIKAVDSSGNESTNATFIAAAALPDPPLAGALLLRDDYALGFPGTRTNCFRDTDGTLRATSSQTWSNLPGAWSSLPATWDGILTNNSPITYVTQTIDLSADLLIKPIVTVIATGTQTVEMRTWKNGESEPGTWSAIAQVTARYIKIRVQVSGSTPIISALQTVIDAPSISDTINDVNTATQATSSWFYRAAAGDIYVQPRNNIAALAMAQITALQNVGGAWTWEQVSKNATAPSGWTGSASPPRAGFPIAQLRIRNAAGTLADATIDILLRGPRS
jgi:hypothetical protein